MGLLLPLRIALLRQERRYLCASGDRIEGSSIHVCFKGKSAKEWRLRHSDRRITCAVRMFHELPGQQLFQYIDNHGASHPIQSQGCELLHNGHPEPISARGNSAPRVPRNRCDSAGRARTAAKPAWTRAPDERDHRCGCRTPSHHTHCVSVLLYPSKSVESEMGELAKLAGARPSRSVRLLRWMDQGEIVVPRWLKGLNGR